MSVLIMIALTNPGGIPSEIFRESPTSVAFRQESRETEQHVSVRKIELRKAGGPDAGPDQPYSVREMGASDLQEFVGGKQVVFAEPYDIFLLLLLVGLVVVLIIVL